MTDRYIQLNKLIYFNITNIIHQKYEYFDNNYSLCEIYVINDFIKHYSDDPVNVQIPIDIYKLFLCIVRDILSTSKAEHFDKTDLKTLKTLLDMDSHKGFVSTDTYIKQRTVDSVIKSLSEVEAATTFSDVD